MHNSNNSQYNITIPHIFCSVKLISQECLFKLYVLLGFRWEKYQNEEEAVLGRGKRLRKAVSYREAYAPHPNETLNEVLHLLPRFINTKLVYYVASED
jgi:hypothetical protein